MSAFSENLRIHRIKRLLNSPAIIGLSHLLCFRLLVALIKAFNVVRYHQTSFIHRRRQTNTTHLLTRLKGVRSYARSLNFKPSETLNMWPKNVCSHYTIFFINFCFQVLASVLFSDTLKLHLCEICGRELTTPHLSCRHDIL